MYIYTFRSIKKKSLSLLERYHLPLCKKYNITDEDIYYGALLQQGQADAGLNIFKADRYKKIFLNQILRKYSVGFLKWGFLGQELLSSNIANNKSLKKEFPNVFID